MVWEEENRGKREWGPHVQAGPLPKAQRTPPAPFPLGNTGVGSAGPPLVTRLLTALTFMFWGAEIRQRGAGSIPPWTSALPWTITPFLPASPTGPGRRMEQTDRQTWLILSSGDYREESHNPKPSGGDV